MSIKRTMRRITAAAAFGLAVAVSPTVAYADDATTTPPAATVEAPSSTPTAEQQPPEQDAAINLAALDDSGWG